MVGKPVLTVLLPEISADNQEGTLHFHYLLDVNGGLLRASRSLDEHVRAAGRRRWPATAAATRRPQRFVAGFVRPFGRDRGGDAAVRRRRSSRSASLPAPAPDAAAA